MEDTLDKASALLGSGLDGFDLFLNIKSRFLARPTYMLWKAIILRDLYKEKRAQ